MGHASGFERQYQLLERQLDRTVTGAPPSPALLRILHILFPREDAILAARLPLQLTDVDELAKRFLMPPAFLLDRLSAMAERGVLFDVEHRGHRYFCLAPLALGFFEFTFMRAREDIPLKELARLFEEYMQDHTSGGIYRSVFQGPTQIGRTLVSEEALPEDHTEVLDWERASHLVRTATAIGVGLCACRHMASHLGRACDKPQRVCLTLNYAAESIIRTGFAERIGTAEAMRIAESCRERGLVQIADNVKCQVAYICNCCGCCCEMFRAVRQGNIRNAITTSNWITQVDTAKCKGCGCCVAACPMGAIAVSDDSAPNENQTPQKQIARLNERLCIGCGVCHAACQRGAISLRRRSQRVLTPETIVDRLTLMAIERGKLADLLFDRAGPVSHRVLGRLVALLEKTPVIKAAAAVTPLRSVFLHAVVLAGKKRLAPVLDPREE